MFRTSPIASDASQGKEPIDLSMSILRSVSPIHIEYLKNMSVGASLSVSIIQQGKLWGLFACHHMSPRHVGYERRSAAELFGQMFALLLESREHHYLYGVLEKEHANLLFENGKYDEAEKKFLFLEKMYETNFGGKTLAMVEVHYHIARCIVRKAVEAERQSVLTDALW